MRVFLPVFLLAFAGCAGGAYYPSPKVEADTDGDTDTADETSPSIAGFIHDPASVGGSWYYVVELDGWADAVILDITENADNPRSESHHLGERVFTMDPRTSDFAKRLPVVDNWDEQKNDVNTVFTDASVGHMVWMFTAYVAGDEITCGVYATDGNTSFVADHGCVEFSR